VNAADATIAGHDAACYDATNQNAGEDMLLQQQILGNFNS